MTWLTLLFGIAALLTLFQSKIRGLIGEKKTSLSLAFLNSREYKIINNLLLYVDERTVQIDHVVVSRYGVFVIETKNYSGLIVGSAKDSHWTQLLGRRKYKLYNPVRQNSEHVKALSSFLPRFDFENVRLLPIVVFTGDAKLRIKSDIPVITLDQLSPTIRNYQNEVMSESTRDKIFQVLKSANIKGYKAFREHVKRVKRLKKTNER